MMDRDTLLAEMDIYWKRLIQALEGVAHDDLEQARLNEDWSVKERLCALTVWDGEALRRIAFAKNQSAKPFHNPTDMDYWQAWERNQIDIKKIMPIKGVMVDMVGTRQRLFTQVENLNDHDFANWLACDPQATNPPFKTYIPQIEAWRKAWHEARPLKRAFWATWLAKLRLKGQ